MKLSAREIAQILNKKRQEISKIARVENWPYSEIPVRGGQRRIYEIERLPNTKIRAAILRSRNPITQQLRILRYELQAADRLIDAARAKLDELEREIQLRKFS